MTGSRDIPLYWRVRNPIWRSSFLTSKLPPFINQQISVLKSRKKFPNVYGRKPYIFVPREVQLFTPPAPISKGAKKQKNAHIKTARRVIALLFRTTPKGGRRGYYISMIWCLHWRENRAYTATDYCYYTHLFLPSHHLFAPGLASATCHGRKARILTRRRLSKRYHRHPRTELFIRSEPFPCQRKTAYLAVEAKERIYSNRTFKNTFVPHPHEPTKRPTRPCKIPSAHY